MEKLVIAVDPGREKCGIAVVGSMRGVLHKEIVSTPELVATVKDLLSAYHTDVIVLGDRTTSKEARRQLEALQSAKCPFTVKMVDEHRSTDAARQRYWQENPPRGLRALIPVTMQIPSVPVDDYVAVILAERYLSGDYR